MPKRKVFANSVTYITVSRSFNDKYRAQGCLKNKHRTLLNLLCCICLAIATYLLPIFHSVTQYLIHTQVVVYRFNKSLGMGHVDIFMITSNQNIIVITTVVIHLSPLVPEHCKTCHEKDPLPQHCMINWFLRLLFMIKTTYGTVVLIIAK